MTEKRPTLTLKPKAPTADTRRGRAAAKGAGPARPGGAAGKGPQGGQGGPGNAAGRPQGKPAGPREAGPRETGPRDSGPRGAGSMRCVPRGGAPPGPRGLAEGLAELAGLPPCGPGLPLPDAPPGRAGPAPVRSLRPRRVSAAGALGFRVSVGRFSVMAIVQCIKTHIVTVTALRRLKRGLSWRSRWYCALRQTSIMVA